VGKTALANLLAKEAFNLGFKPIILPFAGPLKDEACARGFNKKDSPSKYREFCQVHGALKREIDPNYWVKKFEDKLMAIYEAELKDLKEGLAYWQRIVIADDCRYENELSLGKKHKACTIFVSPGNRPLEDMRGKWRQHHSESMATDIEDGDNDLLSLFRYVITNDGTEDDLSYQVESLAPLWTGLQASPNYNKKEARLAMQELVDLFLDDLLESDYNEEDEEDDYYSPE